MVGAAVLADATAGSAAASNGNPVRAGNTTTAEAATTVKYDGTASPGVVFLANDTGFVAGNAAFPAALAGWGGTKVPNGIYGFTQFAGTRTPSWESTRPMPGPVSLASRKTPPRSA